MSRKNLKLQSGKLYIHEREMDPTSLKLRRAGKTDIPGTFNAGATLGPVNETNMTRIWNKHKQTNTPLKRKVFVAMSGGVDSSVAAALLKKRGFKVVGVFFKPWSPSADFSYCNWKQDREDAMRVTSILKITFKTWDFSEDYGKKVAGYMINSYRRGLTPNPDVMCNKEIKFGLFLKRALKEGADFIATGHYVKIENVKIKLQNDKSKLKMIYKLLKAKDQHKDQSYFLWTLTQKELKYCLFPIGDYPKPTVRKMAKKFGLPNYAKKDSQGVCFIGRLDMRDFLKQYIKPKKGDIKLTGSNKIIGRHDGNYYYTIGQRHGLNIGTGGGPYYVADKDTKNNIIYVSADRNKISKKKLNVSDVNWIKSGIKFPVRVQVKIRYRNQSIPAKITINGSEKNLIINFLKPAQFPAQGQSAVFYQKNEVLGGGIII